MAPLGLTFLHDSRAAVRLAWAPPEQLSTSEWADRYRVLSDRVSAEPGPWRTDRAPYLRGIMDALSDTEHLEVIVCKCVQCGGSEAGRNWIGRSVDVDPGPVLIVFPSEQAARENIDERVVPMLSDSPRLAALSTGKGHDVKKSQIRLATCSIYIGWSGSPQALASRPIRRVFCDEIDKYPGYSGKEADPASLAADRTLTYKHRRKVYKVSTPTIPTGPIWVAAMAAGDRRYWHVPCAACGEWLRPDWAQVEFEGRDAEGDELQDVRAALERGEIQPHYRCTSCPATMDADVWVRQVRSGQWISDGYGPGEHPKSTSVSFFIHGLISPWIGMRALAHEYVNSRLQGLGEVQNFFNAFLGQPFWDVSQHGDAQMHVGQADVYALATAGHVRGLVPRWATMIVAGADTDMTGHPYVVRAFGAGYRSRLLDYGRAEGSLDLYRRVFREWPVEGGGVAAMHCRRLCVDVAGSEGKGVKNKSRHDDVYRFCKTDPAHLRAVRGYGGVGWLTRPVVTASHSYKPPGEGRKPYDVTLSTIDTEYFKDLLATRILGEDPTQWEIFDVGSDYVRQIASEKKILVDTKIREGRKIDVWRWVVRTVGAANHFWDAEVYALAGAHMMDMDVPRKPVGDPPGEGDDGPGERKQGSWRVGR